MLDLRSGMTDRSEVGQKAAPSHHQGMKGQKVDEPLRSARRLRDERLRIRHWRRDRFMELGFTLSDAAALAKSPADIHEARKLVSAGCTHATAFRIVR
jgi:hypothetical protein